MMPDPHEMEAQRALTDQLRRLLRDATGHRPLKRRRARRDLELDWGVAKGAHVFMDGRYWCV